MDRIIFESNRTFNLSEYTESHKQLVLHSKKDETTPKRIDVIFKGVEFIQLTCNKMNTIKILRLEKSRLQDNLCSVKISKEKSNKIFEIKTNDGASSYVIALSVVVVENELNYNQSVLDNNWSKVQLIASSNIQ